MNFLSHILLNGISFGRTRPATRRHVFFKNASRFGRLLGVFFFLRSVPAHAEDLPDFNRIVEFVRWGGVLASVPVVFLALFSIRIIEGLGERFAHRFSNRRLAIQKVQTTSRFFIYVATSALVLSLSIRLDATAVAVMGGGLVFAVGFALRDLVASFIAGITIIFDRPFQVGDRVSYGGEYGDIIKIGLRSVRMLTLDHNVITIPNNKVFTDVTSSGNYGALEMQVPMAFYIGIAEDAERASVIVREACLTSPYVYLEMPVPVYIKRMMNADYPAIEIRARPYVFDCKCEEAFTSDVHSRVIEAFRAASIRAPVVLHRSQPL